MPLLSLKTAALALVAGVSLGACSTYGDYGYGYGNGYGSYGYPYGGGYGGGYSNYGYRNGVSISIGTGDYYGWNNGYYYPGSGYYVYDNYRRPYRWNGYQQQYWGSRQQAYRTHHRDRMGYNWSGFGRR